jgi:hypothetical protein
MCEGVWRNRLGQRLLITQCEPDHEQQWTDGDQRYSDNGSFFGRYGGQSCEDLVEYIGPFPQPGQSAEIDRLKAEWQAQFPAAPQPRSEVQQLEDLLDNSRENLRELQRDHTAMDNRAEGARSAFLAVIKTLWEMRR